MKPFDRISLTVPEGWKEELQKQAEMKGLSLVQYLRKNLQSIVGKGKGK